MHATAGRQDPSQADNNKVKSSESPACYLPQPEDALMAQKVKNGTHPPVSVDVKVQRCQCDLHGAKLPGSGNERGWTVGHWKSGLGTVGWFNRHQTCSG